MSKEVKVYITTHALYHGIEVAFTENDINDEYICISRGKYRFGAFLKEDCFLTKEEAFAKADEMRRDEIESLKKKIERLENMTFEIKGE